MGVDYTANYGIGFKIKMPSYEELEEMDLDTDSYLSEVLPPNCSYFEVGSGNYSGKMNDYYVILDDDNLDEGLLERCEKLRNGLITEELIEADGQASVVGGLNVW